MSQQTPTATNEPPVGRVLDWSSHHLLYSGGLVNVDLQAAKSEPRMLLHLADRNLRRERLRERLRRHPRIDGTQTPNSKNLQFDWSFSLGNGNVAPAMYPAKFGFDTSATPSCANDYVVYGLNVVGASDEQANVVGLHNLYSGTGGICGANPTLFCDITAARLAARY